MVHGVDEASGRLYFTASKEDARQRNLFSTTLYPDSLELPSAAAPGDKRHRGRLTGSGSGAAAAPRVEDPVRITLEDGWHEVVLCHDMKRFVDVHCSVSRPYTVKLLSLPDGAPLATIFENADSRLTLLSLPAPELITIKNRQGDELHAALYHPPARFSRPRPLLVSCYGGPDIQVATNSWGLTAAMREQHFAQVRHARRATLGGPCARRTCRPMRAPRAGARAARHSLCPRPPWLGVDRALTGPCTAQPSGWLDCLTRAAPLYRAPPSPCSPPRAPAGGLPRAAPRQPRLSAARRRL
jgi:hypothetical protein